MKELEQKPQTELYVNASKEVEQTSSRDLETIFNQFKLDAELLEQEALSKADYSDPKLLSKSRKELIYPLLSDHGITTWEQLNDESNLIDEKKSNLPSLVRDAIIHLHTHCLITKSKEDGNV